MPPISVLYNIFNVYVGEDLEDSFLKLGNQKHTLINIIYQFLTSEIPQRFTLSAKVNTTKEWQR